MLLGAPQIHNEYFCHNEPHNDAPSVSVWNQSPLAESRWTMEGGAGAAEALARRGRVGLPQRSPAAGHTVTAFC